MHTVLSLDASGGEGKIKTKYRYRLMHRSKVLGIEWLSGGGNWFAKWQPDVFDETGIPIVVEVVNSLNDTGGNWSGPLSGMTLFIFPLIKTRHHHEIWSYTVLNDKMLNVPISVCLREVSATSNNPMSFLFFSWSEKPCFENRLTHDVHSCGVSQTMEFEERAKAYVLAEKLKRMEDSGMINDTVAAKAMSALKVWEGSQSHAMIKRENLKWNGIALEKDVVEQPFQIEECECEEGRDFAYRFVLCRKDGGKVTLSEYSTIQGAFRKAIKEQYHMSHPMADPRLLVVDFTEMSLNDGRVKGHVTVLTLDVERLFYDSSSRRGRIWVKIGANQLEDARRWIRKRIEELATRSNIETMGDKIPSGARFYTGSETLKENGLLEVEFKTE